MSHTEPRPARARTLSSLRFAKTIIYTCVLLTLMQPFAAGVAGGFSL